MGKLLGLLHDRIAISESLQVGYGPEVLRERLPAKPMQRSGGRIATPEQLHGANALITIINCATVLLIGMPLATKI